MRKGHDGESGEVVVVKKKIMAEIVATTSLPVDRLSATDCNAAARANLFCFAPTVTLMHVPIHTHTFSL